MTDLQPVAGNQSYTELSLFSPDGRQLPRGPVELQNRRKRVGEPCCTVDGVRAVHVGHFPCTDQLVFKEAYGQQVTDTIMEEREEQGNSAG